MKNKRPTKSNISGKKITYRTVLMSDIENPNSGNLHLYDNVPHIDGKPLKCLNYFFDKEL